MQHDVLAFADLLHALDSHQQTLDPLGFLCRELQRRADQHGVALQHRLDLAQVVGLQRGACGDKIAYQVSASQPRRNLDRARQSDDLRFDVAVPQVTLQHEWVRSGNPASLQRCGALESEPFRNRE